jgi:hypothetical protein
MKKDKYLTIAKELVQELTHIFGAYAVAQLLVDKKYTYDDLIILGISHEDAQDALTIG